MTTRLRAGVIGCRLGASHAAAYGHGGEDIDLVAICDVNPAAFPRLYDRAKLTPGSLHEYTDLREMLARERLDLVSIATPDAHHAGPVIEAAEAGVRGILCEKPLATTLADADRMIAAVERTGARLLVDHTRVYDPAYSAVRDRIREGYLGELTRIVAHLGGPRAMLFRNGCHTLGHVVFYADADPLWVIGALDRGFEDYGVEYKGAPGVDPALDPGGTLLVEFANGVRAMVCASKRTPQESWVDLIGTRGRIVVSDRSTRAWQGKVEEGSLEEQPVTWAQGMLAPVGVITTSLDLRLMGAVAQLARSVRTGEPANAPAHAGRNVVEILLGALHSQARGVVPVHLPLPRN